MTDTEDFEIKSGPYTLAARVFLPEGAAPDVAYVLHAATGVPRDYYGKFAAWVAEQGHACLTYSYRSDGSDKDSLLASRVTMADWGIADQNAALNALIARFPDAEYRVIGHSLGGFMTMFHDEANRVSRLTAACSGPAMWSRTPFPKVFGAFAFWYLVGPFYMATKGLVPGRLLGSSEDLPSSAFRQWKRWCTNYRLHKPEWGKTMPTPDLEKFSGDLNLVGVTDDWMIPPEVVHDLADFYPKARASMTTVSPQDVGASSIGHLSIFRPKAQSTWPNLL